MKILCKLGLHKYYKSMRDGYYRGHICRRCGRIKYIDLKKIGGQR